jgi:hypothetical protein
MSSIEDRLRRFFREDVTDAARGVAARGVRFFPLGPEPEADTWYLPAPAGEPDFAEIEAEACARLLAERWNAQGLPELARLAGPLLALAKELEFDEEQAADVSPFVYVMY